MELTEMKKLKENGGEASTGFPSLPLELMEDIFLRLPTKSVGRFRCVSKPFCSLLSDPKFVKNHFYRTLPYRRLIFSMNNLFSVDFDRLGDGYEGIRDLIAVELDYPWKEDLDLLSEMKILFESRRPNAVKIVGSVNGFVCTSTYIHRWKKEFLFLTNPTTEESKRIPDLPQSLRTKCKDKHIKKFYIPKKDKHLVEIQRHGFGYDPLTDDYKVVKFVASEDGYSNANVYSLKSDTWRHINNFFYPVSAGVYLNGAIHWIAYLGEDRASIVIAVFDIKTEEFRKMSLPNETKNYHHMCKGFELEILNGCLCVVYSCHERHDDIWVMVEYGLESSWSNILLKNSYVSLKPVCSTKNGKEDLLVHDERLVLYDFECMTSRNLPIHGVDLEMNFEANTYVESLISPNLYVIES